MRLACILVVYSSRRLGRKRGKAESVVFRLGSVVIGMMGMGLVGLGEMEMEMVLALLLFGEHCFER